MGLFDSISNLIHSALGAEAGQLAAPLMQSLEAQGLGGLDGLKAQFEQSGLGAHVAAWTSGQSMPIDADTVQQVLGLPAVQAVATKLGIDPQQAAQLIAQHLPAITQHLAQNAPQSDSASS
jgi:uncharacterized protein YidB (DUF937 family)